MVAIIGLGIMIALVWLLAWSMAGESESEKRRLGSSRDGHRSLEQGVQATRAKQAA